jgi:hypothetical protein
MELIVSMYCIGIVVTSALVSEWTLFSLLLSDSLVLLNLNYSHS